MDLVLVGAGGHAREIAGILLDLRLGAAPLRLAGIAADWGYEEEFWQAHFGCPLLGTVDDVLADLPPGRFVVGIGSGPARAQVGARFVDRGWTENPPLVHPSATVAAGSSLEPGTVVFPGARVSVNVQVGRQTHINVGATIGHDAVLGAGCSLNPNAVVSGNVTLGDRSTVGANATVLERRRIAADVTIGAGAVVSRDIESPGITVVGIPARQLIHGG
ncbi:NeuD/PglB/VioB family sugar acetyltransferase [Nocardioides panacis]|uniref:NeuD/PglB/VioB family sugar acetyltransferase n=1 Tax=Nocardioides panacis TaxID=2849501 RepID=A0A975SYC7_9ACTN|nr:NeuD/PglB/VioB family sugar acetyltransferase [Nocardioides panacis]QWZ08141.1 NeuD/PglB/VioB family sugar acetyltransferase [Nocardioides panacis]